MLLVRIIGYLTPYTASSLVKYPPEIVREHMLRRISLYQSHNTILSRLMAVSAYDFNRHIMSQIYTTASI